MIKPHKLTPGDVISIKTGPKGQCGPTLYLLSHIDGFDCWIRERRFEGGYFAEQWADLSMLVYHGHDDDYAKQYNASERN